MKRLKIFGAESFIFLALFVAATKNYAQQTLFMGELTFEAEGLNDGEGIDLTLSAKSGYTRWFTTPPDWQPPPRLPTSGWDYYYKHGSGPGRIDSYDAPNDNTAGDHAVAWGLYSIRIQVPSRNFDYTFNLDLRDANWVTHDGQYGDTRILYYTSEPHLRYACSNGKTGTVGSSNTIWGWYGRSQNKTDLLVPVTATNSFSGGQIKMDGTTYTAPKTLNWGWTTNHTITAITPQNIGGKKYVFDKWSDGNTNLIRSLTIDDYHNSYSFTAEFVVGFTVTISGPYSLDPYEVGTFTANLSGGTPPYDYTWYRMEVCVKSESESEESETSSALGPPPPPPCNVWVHLSEFDGSQTATSSGIPPGFKMRVDVKDHEGYVISVEKTVYIDLKKLLAQEEANSEAPLRFALLPNYPNPFNPETAIQYELAEESRVILSVYNLLGEEVRRLVNENQPAGTYSIRWDGTDGYGESVSGGLYITKMEAVGLGGRFVQTQKMLFLK